MEPPTEEKKEISKSGDIENLQQEASAVERSSAFKNLGILDRFLAVWILLAMVIGILLGNFVPETGPALQRGQFVGVSVPIGIDSAFYGRLWTLPMLKLRSNRAAGNDVPHPLQGPL